MHGIVHRSQEGPHNFLIWSHCRSRQFKSSTLAGHHSFFSFDNVVHPVRVLRQPCRSPQQRLASRGRWNCILVCNPVGVASVSNWSLCISDRRGRNISLWGRYIWESWLVTYFRRMGGYCAVCRCLVNAAVRSHAWHACVVLSDGPRGTPIQQSRRSPA